MKRATLPRRGQASVEFFLVIAFSFALAAALLSSADYQVRELSSLQKLSATKSGLDAMAGWINYVYLQGNGAKTTGRIFIPQGSVCFILNQSFPVASPNPYTVLQCDADPLIAGRSFSQEIMTNDLNMQDCPPNTIDNPATPGDETYGWFKVIVANTGAGITVTCTKEG